MKQFNLVCNLGLYNAICRIRQKSQTFFLRSRIKTLVSQVLVCRNDIVNKIKKYISKVSVGFANCREWCIACNRPTLDRHVGNAGGLCRLHCLYDVTTIPASVCVVSLVKVLLSCSRMSTASCNTLWLNTDAISIDITIRRPCIAAARSSVSQRSPFPKHSKLHSRA